MRVYAQSSNAATTSGASIIPATRWLELGSGSGKNLHFGQAVVAAGQCIADFVTHTVTAAYRCKAGISVTNTSRHARSGENEPTVCGVRVYAHAVQSGRS